MKGADKGVWCWACKLLSKQRRIVVRGGVKWGDVVRPMVVASANCGQDPQWHYTQCGSRVLVMFTAWVFTNSAYTFVVYHKMHSWYSMNIFFHLTHDPRPIIYLRCMCFWSSELAHVCHRCTENQLYLSRIIRTVRTVLGFGTGRFYPIIHRHFMYNGATLKIHTNISHTVVRIFSTAHLYSRESGSLYNNVRTIL